MSDNPSSFHEGATPEDFPLISVIVPVYKVERYLDRCVQSIVDQTYRNLEIILVDDGSPDSCPDMCDAWIAKDYRIRVRIRDWELLETVELKVARESS